MRSRGLFANFIHTFTYWVRWKQIAAATAAKVPLSTDHWPCQSRRIQCGVVALFDVNCIYRPFNGAEGQSHTEIFNAAQDISWLKHSDSMMIELLFVVLLLAMVIVRTIFSRQFLLFDYPRPNCTGQRKFASATYAFTTVILRFRAVVYVSSVPLWRGYLLTRSARE